jgi:hypothetical protein
VLPWAAVHHFWMVGLLAVAACGAEAAGPEAAVAEGLLAEDRAAEGKGDLDAGRIWRPALDLPDCAVKTVRENFASGRFIAHRWTSAELSGRLEVTLTSTAGAWSPEVLLVRPDRDDATVRGAAAGGGVTLGAELSGRERVYLFISDTRNLDRPGASTLPRDAAYSLEVRSTCPPAPPARDLASIHAGLDLGGLQVPRAGLRNDTLRRALGVAVEPYGPVVDHGGLQFVKGKGSWFGGPRDTGVSSTETGSVSGERLRSLSSPMSPSPAELAASPERFYYLAMRFDYVTGIEPWRRARFLVVNPTTGAAAVVRAVDWGPNTSTGRIVDVSPQTLTAIAASTDQPLLVSFARPDAPLGPLTKPE